AARGYCARQRGGEDVWGEALVDVVLGAELERERLVLVLVHRRAVQHDRGTGHGGIAAERLGELEAVETRHTHVRENHVRALGLGGVDGLATVVDDGDLEALGLERDARAQGLRGTVFDDEHLGHCRDFLFFAALFAGSSRRLPLKAGYLSSRLFGRRES